MEHFASHTVPTILHTMTSSRIVSLDVTSSRDTKVDSCNVKSRVSMLKIARNRNPSSPTPASTICNPAYFHSMRLQTPPVWNTYTDDRLADNTITSVLKHG
jgi:hypothetical protein